MKTYAVLNAVRTSSLKATQRWVLVCVAHRAGEDGECWASAPTLGGDARLSEREVRRTLAELVKLGALSVDHRKGRTAVYRVTGTFPTPDQKSGDPGHPVTPDHESPRTGSPDTPDQKSGPPRTGSPDTPDQKSDDPIPDKTPDSTPDSTPPPPSPPPGGERVVEEGPTATLIRPAAPSGPSEPDPNAVAQLLRLEMDANETEIPGRASAGIVRAALRDGWTPAELAGWFEHATKQLGAERRHWRTLLGSGWAESRAKWRAGAAPPPSEAERDAAVQRQRAQVESYLKASREDPRLAAKRAMVAARKRT